MMARNPSNTSWEVGPGRVLEREAERVRLFLFRDPSPRQLAKHPEKLVSEKWAARLAFRLGPLLRVV